MTNLKSTTLSIFHNKNVRYNIKRILIIGSVYSLFEIVGLTLSTLGFFESDIRIYVAAIVLFHLLYLPILAYFAYAKKNTSPRMLSRIHCIYYPVIISWASIFTWLMYLDSGDITIYSFVILLCSALFIIQPIISIRIYSLAILFFGILIYIQSDSILIGNELFFKSIIVTAIAFTISYSNYRIRYHLNEANNQLSAANRILKEQVDKDSLTGLYNNGYIFKYLDTVIDNLSGPLSVIMIDIDDFKKINDTYGHLEGDMVIRSISDILNILSETKGVVARYGGEEFIIVCHQLTLEKTEELAHLILTSIRDLKFTFGAGVTVSLGVSMWDQDNRDSLIKKADEQLYQAKNTGKNKVCVS